MSANYKKDVLPCLWYRHSGQPEIDGFPSSPTTTSIDERAITRDVGNHHITHLYMENGVIPSLAVIAPQLTHLWISGISATSQLHNLSSLSKLEQLKLSYNDFSNGLPAGVGQLTSLERLDLDGCQLTDLPQSLSSLTKLEWLYLYSNKLSDLPQSLSSLSKLWMLDLSSNKFSESLPAVVVQLTSLEILDLSHNELSDLPQSLSSLSQLKWLSLSHNELSDLPQSVSSLTQLKELSLSHNKLSDLPQSLSSLTQLKELSLSHNKLSDLPQSVSYLSQLTALRLSNNKLSDLPQSLSSLSQLEELDLSDNKLSDLPHSLSSLTQLKQLYLSDNKLSDLPQSLSSLSKLEELNLSENDFSKDLPAVVGQLTSLESLYLSNNKLSDLPQRFSCETQLEFLDLSFNNFVRLPPAIHRLSNMKVLDLRYNKKLQRLDEEVFQLQNLEELRCSCCESLQSPPYGVCKQGLSAVKKYFADLKVEKGKELLLVPVAVVGMKNSGKSSLIKSLQADERRLTFRGENSPLDETTKVFAIEELELKDCRVKFVDYGGHEIYHLAYQLVIKERCIPLIVVNIEEFHKLSQSEGVEEATRKLCINWCSHLYLACPRLGPPLLILTHTDKLAVDEVKQCKEQLLTTSEDIRRKIVTEIQQCSGEFSGNAQPMIHFSHKKVKLFNPVDVFEFSNDLTERSNIENLKVSLVNHCKSFKVEIPRLWEKVEEFVNEQDTMSYIFLSEVTNKFSSDDPQIILRYMHNIGKILWFEEIEELRSYIFHDIPAITEMISLLLHHSSDKQWKRRVADFTIFLHNGEKIGAQKYKSFVDRFTSTGVIDEALLAHLLKTGSRFPTDLTVDLLKGFLILHGPIEQSQQNRKAYILPYFASSSLDDSWKTAGPVPLRLEIGFGGLSPPQYVYQLMTVVVLNLTSCVLTDVSVNSNGVTIRHGKCSTNLVHDVSHRKITLQVSTPVAQLHKSWKHLVKTSRSILHQLSRVWKACHAEVLVYCAQCLFLRRPNPGCVVDPYWLHSIDGSDHITSVHTVTTNSALEEVLCPGCSRSTDRTPDVPKPFKFPCEDLSEGDIHRLDRHISAVKRSYSVMSAGAGDDVEPTTSVLCTTGESDLSDVEEEGYCDTTYSIHLSQRVRLKVVRDERIKLLYTDSDKVYLMSDGVRGRALIVNIQHFSYTTRDREGSTVDCANISKLFIDLKFDIAKSQDLTAEEIYKVIREETQRDVHHKLGMFVLVIMSYGGSRDILKDCKNQPVPLINIQDLLSPSNFPAMKDKPKLIIVQACSGDRVDFGDSKQQPLPTADDGRLTFNRPSKPSRTPPAVPLPPTTLNADDFMIMKASSESYIATRSPKHGSWFIRVLVATFYRHCCHRDVESLFKIIQQRVRQVSLKHKSAGTDDYLGGNVPTSICTFTDYRKLYLFPGCRTTR